MTERIEDWYDAYLSCCERCDRLRATNANLLEALERIARDAHNALSDEYALDADDIEVRARAAIAAAKGEA